MKSTAEGKDQGWLATAIRCGGGSIDVEEQLAFCRRPILIQSLDKAGPETNIPCHADEISSSVFAVS